MRLVGTLSPWLTWVNESRHLHATAPRAAPPRSVIAAMLAGVIGASACSATFWLSPDRATAGWVVLVVLPWGLLVSILPRGSVDLRIVLAAGLVTRAVLIGTPPLLSDDLYRYLFEGLALNNGHNPFLEAPATLTALDPWLAERVNHPDIPSIYPPVAQWWFRLLAFIDPRPLTAQALTAGVDLLGIALLHRICLDRGAPTWPALVWALHPLAVLESAHGAHLETLAVATCLLTLWSLRAGRPFAASAAAATGVGVKLLPALFVPALVRALGPKRAIGVGLVGLLALVALAAPVLGAGPALLEAFGTYSRHWSFNGLLHPLFSPLLGDGTRVVLALLGLGIALHAATHDDPAKTWRQIGAAFLVVSPTVHPWYVLWVLAPALVLGGRAWAVAGVFLQCSYGVLLYTTSEGWSVPPWLGPVTWGPALLVLLFQARRDWSPTAP